MVSSSYTEENGIIIDGVYKPCMRCHKMTDREDKFFQTPMHQICSEAFSDEMEMDITNGDKELQLIELGFWF